MVANISKFQSSKTDLISAQSLVQDIQKDVNKEGTADHKLGLIGC
jgi:hypothetical protein